MITDASFRRHISDAIFAAATIFARAIIVSFIATPRFDANSAIAPMPPRYAISPFYYAFAMPCLFFRFSLHFIISSPLRCRHAATPLLVTAFLFRCFRLRADDYAAFDYCFRRFTHICHY